MCISDTWRTTLYWYVFTGGYMEKIKLLVDTCCDLPKELLDKNNIEYVEMTYVLDGVEYSSFQEDVTYDEFYDRLSKGSQASTSCVNTETFKEKFASMTADGSSVLYIAFSSGLSATYTNAVNAANAINEELGKERVVVYDSLSASLGYGYTALLALQLLKEGRSVRYITNELKHTPIAARFTVADLMHLKRGGRLSGLSAMVGKVLNIQPMLVCDNEEGKLKVVDKVMGKKAMYAYFVKKIAAEIEENEAPTIYITHCSNEEGANSLKNEVLKIIPKANIEIYYIGHVIGSHTGKGAIALFYKLK